MRDEHGELLALALTGRNCGVRFSSLLNLSERFNEVIALDFDLTCTARLRIEDAEREQRQLEAMSGGLLMNALQGPQTPKPTGKKMQEGTF